MAQPTPQWLRDWLRRHPGVDPATVGPGGDAGLGSSNGGGGGGEDSLYEDPFGDIPYGTYPPEYAAQARAIERGLDDTLFDTRQTIKRAKKDQAQQLHDLAVSKRRGLRDTRTERKRGLEDIGLKRTDIQTEAARGREDFGTRLRNLVTDFQQQGSQQTQASAARGVFDSSTTAASAAARAANFARARQPIDTGLARLNEDETRSLSQLGTAQGRLLTDTGRAAHQLRQDVRHDTRLSERDLRRTIKDQRTERQRARREAAITTSDLVEQAAFAAHEAHPGAVPKPRNPNAPKKRH